MTRRASGVRFVLFFPSRAPQKENGRGVVILQVARSALTVLHLQVIIRSFKAEVAYKVLIHQSQEGPVLSLAAIQAVQKMSIQQTACGRGSLKKQASLGRQDLAW